MSENNQNQSSWSKLEEHMEGFDLCMLTTVHGNELRSRPMSTQKPDRDGELVFLTMFDTQKADEISQNPNANVAYTDHGKMRYVSISGTAKLSRDPEKVKELWNPLYKAWFPNGPEDPDIAVIRLTVTGAEYWDGPSSKMVALFEMVKAAVTGTEFNASENETLDFSGSQRS